MNDDDSPTEPWSNRTHANSRAESDSRPLTSDLCSFESFEYYPDDDRYQTRFDPRSTRPSEAVVGVITAADDVDPFEVEQLGRKTDVSALNDLISNRRRFEGDVHVSFTLHGYAVRVSSYGSIVARPAVSTNS